MARIIYQKYQNKNRDSAAFGKWFARLKSMETLNTRKLAQHISEHVEGIHIRFLPETAQEQNLSSREFLKKCSFIDVKDLAGIKDEEPEP